MKYALTPNEHRAIFMRDSCGSTFGEIATEFGVTAERARQIYTVGRKKSVFVDALGVDSLYIVDVAAANALANYNINTWQDFLVAIYMGDLPDETPNASHDIPVENLGVARYELVLQWSIRQYETHKNVGGVIYA